MRTTRWKLLAATLLAGVILSGCTSGGDDAGGEETDASSVTGETETAAETASEEESASEEDTAAAAEGGGTLAEVTERGTLNCGVNGQLDGFSLNEGGTYTGFDVDFCRAIAAALFDDPEAVTYTDLTAETRFTALQSGEVDVLIRNGTWTASRDGDLGLQWTQTTFYDGQGMLVRADSEFQSLADMTDTTICVQSGTTTELNLTARMAELGVTYEPLLLPDEEQVASSFQSQACDGYTTDRSGLASFRSSYAEGPDSLRILDDVMSKEPLGPAVREGDQEWFDVVNWVVFATIQAEEFGLDSTNIATAAEDNPDNAEILRFVGAPGEEDSDFTSGLSLEPDFAVRVVGGVGNYAEIYERNITPLGLERGLNNLWNADEPGVLYAPPYR